MKIDGSCHCGAIRYEAEIEPEAAIICHCTDCQALSGGAFRVLVPTREDDFRLTAGQPKTYVKTADSGAKRIHAFCPACGAPVYASAIADPPFYSLRVGCLQQRADLAPQKQIWCRSSLPWSEDIGDVPKIDRQ